MWEHFKNSQTKYSKNSAEGLNTLQAVKLKLRLFSIVPVLQLTLKALGFSSWCSIGWGVSTPSLRLDPDILESWNLQGW